MIWLLAYSDQGCKTGVFLARGLMEQGEDCRLFAPKKHCVEPLAEPLDVSLEDWAGQAFAQAEALVFCCAAGIAVRAIAPYVHSKKTDPAVVVLDEGARWAISLLSGHLGGANDLARRLGDLCGAQPVITTATDLNGLFAVDVFAKKNHLYIERMDLAKEVSAALLAKERVGFFSELPVAEALPQGLLAGPFAPGEAPPLGIVVGTGAQAPFERCLYLRPRPYVAGLGCRKGQSFEALRDFLRQQLEDLGLEAWQLRALASIDIKKEEPGLVALAKELGLPFVTYSAQELNQVTGSVSASDFVRRTVGVDCVCERAALAAGGGRLLRPKRAWEGMTFALAVYEEELHFE